MFSTLVVLSDGTQIRSGSNEDNVIVKASITDSCNSGTELTLGSTCASMLELSLITPEGNLSIDAGDVLTVFKIDELDRQVQLGIFNAEKPVHTGANTMTIMAYDNISRLDKDLTQWLASLQGWPYSVQEFVNMVCEACDLVFNNDTILNGDYIVNKFSAEGITGRQLIQWAAEISASFCRATNTGEIEFFWYNAASVNIGPEGVLGSTIFVDFLDRIYIDGDTIITDDEKGNVQLDNNEVETIKDDYGNVVLKTSTQLYYYQGEFSFEDYIVDPIGKVQLKQSDEDIGTVYPDTNEELNTYVISGNYLITANTADTLVPVAKNIFERIKEVSYTPGTLSLPATLSIKVGNIIQIIDRNGRKVQLYAMTLKQTGQRYSIECTGSKNRTTSSAVNNQSYKALTGKILNLRTDIEGLKVENKDTRGNLSSITLDIENIKAEVQSQITETNNNRESIASLNIKADQIDATIKSIKQEGTSKVETEFGLSIDESYVRISRSDSDMTNQLNEKGMYIVRDEGSSNETVMLKADSDGVLATDVTVRNYLIIGNYARFEDFITDSDDKRTACFWIGGS